MSQPNRTDRFSAAFLPAVISSALLWGCAGAGRAPDADVVGGSALPEHVLVLPLEDRSGSNDPDLAPRVTEMLVAQVRLVALSAIGPREAAEIAREMGAPLATPPDAESLRRFCEVTGCEAVLTGAITAYAKGKAWSDDRLALTVRAIDPRTGRTIRGTSFTSAGVQNDAAARGLDQLCLYGVETVTRELARAGSR